MRFAETALGALLILAVGAGLPLGILSSGRARDLQIGVTTPEPHAIAPRPEEPLGPLTVGPPELLPRLEQRGAPDRAAPGLSLLTWQVTYGHRWERQVTFPVLYGPFDPEGTPWPCAFAVKLAPSFFDDGKPGGADVEAVLDRMVRAQFPMNVFGLHFASVASTALKVRPIAGALEVSGAVTLADGGRGGDPTRFYLKGRIGLGERDGDLAPKLEDLQVTWAGRTRHDPLVSFASFFMNVDAQARGEVRARLEAALSVLKLPKEPFALFEDRPSDRVVIRLCNAPVSRPDGLTVNLRVVAKLAEPRVDPQIPGPTRLVLAPRIGALAESGPEEPTLSAVASPAAVHQALYLLWQAGQLTRWGTRRDVVSSIRDKLADRLALDFAALQVRLPPSVLSGDPGDTLSVRFADVALGRLEDGRTAVAHGDVKAAAEIEGGRIGLRGTLTDLRITCVAERPQGFTLSPCFSDVVPVIRQSGFTSEGLPLEMPIPEKLLRLNLVLGTDLVLRDVRAELTGGELRLRASAQLVDKGVSSPKPAKAH
jgi:hypothetical protein